MIIVIALFVLSYFINATHYQSYRTHQVLILGFTKTNFNSKLISQDINEHEKLEDCNFHPASKVLVNVFIIILRKVHVLLLIHVLDIKKQILMWVFLWLIIY